MSIISGTITTGVTLGTGTYTSPLTITSTGIVSDNAGAAVNAGPGYVSPVLLNQGTVIATAGHIAVRFMDGGSVDNSGLIGGDYGSVYIYGAAGTVTNSGTIAGAGNVPHFLLDAAVLLSAGGTVINSGTIVGTDAWKGVHLLLGGGVENDGGLITGADYGVYITGGAGLVTNSGTIAGTGAHGAGVALRAGGYIVNDGGLITGHHGVFLDAGGIVANNAGLIQGYYNGVFGLPGGGTVSNSGTIAAAGNNRGAAVSLRYGGSVSNNAGVITGRYGIEITGTAGAVTNTGMITGANYSGVVLGYGGNVANNGGVITGYIYGVHISRPGTVTNSGTITATSVSGIGVELFLGGYVANNGGSITAEFGVSLYTGGTVANNAGLIQGDRVGVLIKNSAGTVSNSGVITGGATAIELNAGGTVINSGTIVGGSSGVAIEFHGTSGNVLGLQAGYVISGGVAGSGSGQAIDVLELDGAAAAPLTVNYNGLALTYFEKVLFGAGNYNTLLVSNNSGLLPVTISGFDSYSEIIDLTGIGSDGQVTNNDTANQRVTVSGSLGSVTLQLDASDGTAFATAPDGTGGTDLSIACFLRGTRIRTAIGEVPIEELTIGDQVVTRSGEEKPIRWIGRRAYDRRFVAGNRRVLPVCVGAGALDETTPARDLWVSPEHSFLMDGVLVQAMHLVNGATITQPAECNQVEYFHIELETHDVIFAEGATVETFIDCDNRFMFQNAADYTRLYPDDERPHWLFCAPRPDRNSAEVTAIRAALLALAEARGRVNRDPDLHLIVDGRPIKPHSVADGAYRFLVPAGARGIAIRSRTAIPAETESNATDLRPLGVPLRRVMLQGDGMHLEITSDCPALRDGFHGNEGSHRWTNGHGKLPPELLACFAGDVAIEVQIAATDLHYPINAPTVDPRQEQPNTLPVMRGVRITAGLAYSAAAASGRSGSMPRARL